MAKKGIPRNDLGLSPPRAHKREHARGCTACVVRECAGVGAHARIGAGAPNWKHYYVVSDSMAYASMVSRKVLLETVP